MKHEESLKEMLKEAEARKESIGIVFPPFADKFLKEARKIFYVNLVKMGYIMPEAYFEQLDDAFWEIGKAYYDIIHDNEV